MTEPKPSYHPNPSRPKLVLPEGACDAHFHVFGPQARFPFPANRTYTPADAPKERLFALHDHLGIGRGVVVQAGAHGFDNSAAADLIASRPGKYVGVALLPVSVSDDDLKNHARQGFRGVRFNYMGHLGKPEPVENVLALAKRIAPLGWHLQIHMDPGYIEGMAPQLAKSPVPVVIDHMGRVDASLGVGQPPFQALLTFMNRRRDAFVKVSGSERLSKEAAPWKDARPFARKLVAEFGDRVLWGTDWPHPNLKEIPDDGVLVDLLPEIAPSEAARQALLVDNPARLYGFK